MTSFIFLGRRDILLMRESFGIAQKCDVFPIQNVWDETTKSLCSTVQNFDRLLRFTSVQAPIESVGGV